MGSSGAAEHAAQGGGRPGPPGSSSRSDEVFGDLLRQPSLWTPPCHLPIPFLFRFPSPPFPARLLLQGVLFAALLLHKDVLHQQSFSLSPPKPILSPVPVSGQPVSVGDSSECFGLPRKTARVPPVPLGVPEGDKGKKNKLSRLAPGKNPCCSENKAARGSRRVQAAQAPQASPKAERTQDARSSPKARQGGTRWWAEGVLLHQN